MKILRFLLRCLAWLAALVVLLLLVELFPNAQTWTAQLLLARRPDLHGSLDYLAAGFGRVEIDNLKLRLGDANLSLPHLRARLPVSTALVVRRLHVHSLVARGWLLEFGPPPAPAEAPADDPSTSDAAPPAAVPAPAAPTPPATQARAASAYARRAAALLLGTLRRWSLPFGLSLDGVDLEGDVVGPPPANGGPVRVHLVIKGGGLAAGHPGRFTVEATSDLVNSELVSTTVTGQGVVVVTMRGPRAFRRVEARIDLGAQGGLFPQPVTLSTDATTALEGAAETYSLDLIRDGHRLVGLDMRDPDLATGLAGTWQLNLSDTDVTAYAADLNLPDFTVAGAGRFHLDPRFTQMQVHGRIQGTAGGLGVLAPWLDRLGTVRLRADFSAVQFGRSLRVDQLGASLHGTGPKVTVRTLQPFTLDERTGTLEPAAAAKDWADVGLDGLPSEWLSPYLPGFALAGGSAAGDFIVRRSKDGFDLRSHGPLHVTGVSLARAGRVLGRNLDLAFALQGEVGPAGWHYRAAPLTMSNGGDRFARLTLKASRTGGADQPMTVAGDWKAQLDEAGFRRAIPDLAPFGGRSTSGTFSGTLGDQLVLDGKLSAVGLDPHHTVEADVHLTAYGDQRIDFRAPALKLVLGAGTVDLSAQGSVIRDEAQNTLYLKLKGKDFDLAPLRFLAEKARGVGDIHLAGVRGAARDLQPFWGRWVGRMNVDFDRFKAGNLVINRLAGSFSADHHRIRIEGARGYLAGHEFADVTGALAFDAHAARPYDLTVKAKFAPIEAASLVPATTADLVPSTTSDGSPVVAGRFSVEASAAGRGVNLGDLLRHTQETVRLSSNTGVVRILKTNVNEATPVEHDSAATDTLGRLGSGVGRIFDMQNLPGAGMRKVGQELQEAIDVVNQTAAIGYDRFDVTVVREADRSVRIENLAVVADGQRATGSGTIAYVPGKPLRDRPLHLHVQYGVRDWYAKLMAAAGLLSSRKDDHGYTLLKEPIAISGTLAHPDNRQWHELLVKSAERQPGKSEKAKKRRF